MADQLPELPVEGTVPVSNFDSEGTGAAAWNFRPGDGSVSRCQSQGWTVYQQMRARLTGLGLAVDPETEGIGNTTLRSMASRAAALGIDPSADIATALAHGVASTASDATSAAQETFTDADRIRVTLWAVYLAFYDAGTSDVHAAIRALGLDGDTVPLPVGYSQPPPVAVTGAPTAPQCIRYQDTNGATSHTTVRRGRALDHWGYYAAAAAVVALAKPVTWLMTRR